MVKEWCWFSQINLFQKHLPHRINILILCHPHTQIRIILFLCQQRSISNSELSPNCTSIELSRIALSLIVLPQDDRTNFVQEERLGLPYWTMILAICALVDVSKCLDIPSLEFSTICEHLPFLPGCKRILRLLHPRSFDIISIIFAAVICDADGPCSVNTACDPESSSTVSPRSTTRPLYFWCFASNSAFFKWQMSISEAEWTFAPFVLVSSITSFSVLTFVSCHAGIFPIVPFFFSTAAFAPGMFNARSIGINLCTKS